MAQMQDDTHHGAGRPRACSLLYTGPDSSRITRNAADLDRYGSIQLNAVQSFSSTRRGLKDSMLGMMVLTLFKCLTSFVVYRTLFPFSFSTTICADAFIVLDTKWMTVESFTRLAIKGVHSQSDERGSTKDDVDWRAFRAQLVQSESNGLSTISTEQSSHWAYDSGDFVEPGSVVVSIPSSDPVANDIDALNNQCYRKCIVLVLDITNDFIQGIILNRPTNIRVVDGMKFAIPHADDEVDTCTDSSDSSQWKVWFGGESLGPYSDSPQVMCLHSVQTDLAMDVSKVVLPGILMTSFDGAQAIVKAGDGKPSDFWLFSGVCGWKSSSFYREMHEEGLWKIVSSDGGTILEELNLQRCEEEELAADEVCDVDSDSRNAGVHTWEILVDKIGKGVEAHVSDDFGDLMLREWATSALSFTNLEDRRGVSSLIDEEAMVSDTRIELGSNIDFHITQYDPTYDISSLEIEPAQQLVSQHNAIGAMIRGSSVNRSPFLLSDQAYHKSLVLILHDNDDVSTGVILNLVTDRTYSITLDDGEVVVMTVRYGGPIQEGEEGEMLPLVFLHANGPVAEAGYGSVVASGIFQCTSEEVADAMSLGFAHPDDFMAIQGLSVWHKTVDHGNVIGGVFGDIEEGFFQLVSQKRIAEVWKTLIAQSALSHSTFETNVELIHKAWSQASKGESDQEINRVLVFGSDVDVVELADEALRRWIKTHLLL